MQIREKSNVPAQRQEGRKQEFFCSAFDFIQTFDKLGEVHPHGVGQSA